KLERGDASVSFGAWYMYKSQSYEFPQFSNATSATTDAAGNPVRRDAYAHTLDLWSRYQTKRFRFEVELAGIVGQIANAATDANGAALGPVLLRQFGGAAQADWSLASGKFHLGGEVGFASGDRSPGFGNRPARGCTTTPCQAGVIDGPQFSPKDGVQDIRNFRFNPAYRVDLILWREILQGVTDAFYLKPTARYELIEGVSATASLIYSQAIYASSTPSTTSTPLGVELDLGLAYHSDDGFVAFVNYGVLQPLDGLGYGSAGAPATAPQGSLARGHAIRSGVAVKF
ncbi:MAG TPA: TIGR04551 family protein, partial [Anaeromyxobacteraceae bacterium]